MTQKKRRRERYKVRDDVVCRNSIDASFQVYAQTQIATQRKRLRFGKEEQQNERALTFTKKSEQAI